MLSLGTLIEWWLYGAIRYVLFWIPGVLPFGVDRGMPWQWLLYNSVWDWLHYNDNHDRPDEVWLNAWFRMCLGETLGLAAARAQPLIDAVKDRLLTLIGAIRGGFPSLGSWVDWLQRAIGYALPAWVPNISVGLEWLRSRFPDGIIFGWQTWDAIWDGIKSAVQNWAKARFDRAVSFARNAYDWVVRTGSDLRQWRDRVGGWIDTFRANPYVYITAALGGAYAWLLGFYKRPRSMVLEWLGSDWPRLQSFAGRCLDFYFALWSRGADLLSQIIENPGKFIADWLENELEKRW